MIPLNKSAAVDKVLGLRWRVTVADYRTGVPAVYDRREETGRDAMFAALTEFEAMHPECDDYGVTHGLTRCVRVGA